MTRAASSAGVRRPSEWTVWVCRSPRYQARPRPPARSGAGSGTNAGPAGGGGRAVLEAVRQTDQDIRFLALSVSDAAEDVIGVIRAGARGYVTKTISPPDLAAAIRRVHGGDAVFSPRLAGFVLDAFAASGPAAPAPAEDPATDPGLDLLSAREREVMQLLARGYTYREIGSRLFISVKTVESHASNVLRKLQLSNRNELTRWAATNRLL